MADAPPELELGTAAPAPDAGQEEDQDSNPDKHGDGIVTPLISTGNFTPEIGFPGEPVVLHDRFEVFPAKPLPELDSPSARAFGAEDLLQTDNRVFALICMSEIPARQNVINSISGDEVNGVIKLFDFGKVEWSFLKKWCQVLIYERPAGGRVAEVLASGIQNYQRVDIIGKVLRQCIETLEYLQIRGQVHRALRPDNLYFRDESREEIILGDFLSSPPGFDQPLVFETPERGMASVGGRGRGDIRDDYYALGVTVAYFLQSGLPVSAWTAEQVIHSKITRSSYQTLVGRNLLTSAFVEPLRGLLDDNPNQRWGFDTYEMWASGRRVPASQTPARQRLPRALKFGEFEHIEPRSLAYAMSLRPDMSIKLIRDGTLETWLSRGIEDRDLADTVTGIIGSFKSKEKETRDADSILLAHILLAMDPLGPVRYKGAHFMTDGFGGALATETIRGGNVQDLAHAIANQIPTKSFEVQEGGLAASVGEESLYQQMRLHLQKTDAGFGIERCLYLANPGLACRSPLLQGRYVNHIDDMLPVLSELESSSDTKQRPYDRHIAAFLASHYQDDIDILFEQAVKLDEARGIITILKIYSTLQSSLQQPEVPGLASWLGGLMGPVVGQFKSRSTRRLLETEVPKVARIGWLPDLLELLDNTDAKLGDGRGYAEAHVAFREAGEEIERFETNSSPESDAVQRGSKQAAAVFSIVIMCTLVTIMALTR